MTAFSHFFRPKADRSGVQLCTTSCDIGTGGRALTATATVSVCLPIPRRKCKLLSLNLSATTAAAGGSTITAQTFKRNNQSTPADVTLTAAFDLTATVITVLDKSYSIPLTGTDTQRIFQTGDDCRVDIAAATTVTTAPQMTLCAEWAILG